MRSERLSILMFLAACGGGGGSGGGDEAPVPDAAAAPSDAARSDVAAEGDASLIEQMEAYCRDAARARCEWAFECVGVADRNTVLGLRGDDAAACAELDAAPCLADLRDRGARETVAFDAQKIADCVTGLRNAPCQMSAASTWIDQWIEYAQGRCSRVAPGTVAAGDACRTGRDCATSGQICADNTCRDGRATDVLQECDAENPGRGALNVDSICPGELCVQVGPNEQEKKGLCTIDCSGALFCPAGTACLHISPENRPPIFICTKRCMADADCDHGYACYRISSTDLTMQKHCWVDEK